MRKKTILKLLACILPLLIMAYIDSVLTPPYALKSLMKICLFAVFPLIISRAENEPFFGKVLKLKTFKLGAPLAIGGGLFILIVLAYFAFDKFFDFSLIAPSVAGKYQVSKSNYIAVALYLTICNSFLEEAFFRGFCFSTAFKAKGRIFAYVFSSGAFALYHAPIISGWLPLPIIMLMILGLGVGGAIFCALNERFNSLYASWAVHAACDMAISIIGWRLVYMGL